MIRAGLITLALSLGFVSASAQDATPPMNVDDFMAIDGSVDNAKGVVQNPASLMNVDDFMAIDGSVDNAKNVVDYAVPSLGNDVPIAAAPIQETCITIMSGFPDNGHEPRYQFFKLTQALTADVDSTLRASLDFFGDSFVTPQTPVTEVIENIANPVFRQAAPEITIGNMGYLIDFALDCETYLSGQIESLEAYDSTLTDVEFNTIIAEDALFMRQILSDSLFRVGAQDHEIFGPSVHAYAGSLVTTRDKIEFSSFETELESLEALYLDDLDGRLARSNDVINSEMDREALANSLEITEDLNQDAKRKSKENMLRTLSRILGGR